MDQVYFTQERREAATRAIIGKLNELKDLDFNTLIFAFADIMQSSFLNALHTGKSKEEREVINQAIVDLNNSVIDTLNNGSENMLIDMVVLSNLIMDAVENAMQNALADSKQ